MGGIFTGSKSQDMKKAKNNLHYIVSYYFTQERKPQKNKNPFIMCQQVQEDKRIKNFPLVSFKYDKNNLKYTKYDYREFNIIQMIMLTPDIFVSLTEDGIQLWYDKNGMQKISTQFFDKIKNNNNADITDYQLTKFNNDLFYLTFNVNQKQHTNNINVNLYNNFNKINELQGFQFILFSASKIIKEGKMVELFSINKINFAFCISSTQVMTIENDIKVMNFSNKKIFKIDKENEILKYPLTYARYLTQDLVLISSKFKKFSVIYSADLLDTVYKINDFIEIAFNLGDDKIIMIGKNIKQIIFLPDIQVLSLNQYETDIFGSFSQKTFYPINNTTFFSINHKNRKLKQIFLNQENELIIKNEFLCPLDMLHFCPFTMDIPESSKSSKISSDFFCALFICKEQTYYLKNEKLYDFSLTDDSFSSFYSSKKRLFYSYFENTYIEIIKPIESILNSKNDKEIKSEITNIYLPFTELYSSGESKLHFALLKNKTLKEYDISVNLSGQEIQTELINKENNSEIYIISIINNSMIHIVKINDNIVKEKEDNFNFGNIVKNIGILNLGEYLSFIYYDKKAILINVEDSFENKVNPIDTFLFPFDIIYACNCDGDIILVSKQQIFLFDYNSKNIEKKIELNIDISLKFNKISINQIQDEVYILTNGLNYCVFDINKFEIISDIREYNLDINTFLLYNSLPDKFEIIKKDLRSDINIQIFREEVQKNKQKIKYLSNGRLFVSCYPNKFFIFYNY